MFVEVYNKKVRDLLVPPGDGSRLKVRLGGDGFQVEAKERVARCTADLVSIASEGEKSRSVGSTEMNVRSSRSHTIFRIVVECASDGERALSTLCLVDLAGSESLKHTGATGNRQRDGGKINQSLLALSRVINKLAENRNFSRPRSTSTTPRGDVEPRASASSYRNSLFDSSLETEISRSSTRERSHSDSDHQLFKIMSESRNQTHGICNLAKT